MRTSTFARRGIVAGAALTLALGLGGCSAITNLFGGQDATRNDDGEIVEAGTTDAFSLKVGDCFNSGDLASEFSEVPTIPCGDAHEDELFYEFTMPDGDFPGQDALDAAVQEQCTPEFESFVGTAYDASTLDFWALYPTPDGWAQANDRLVQCAVYDTTQQSVTGSLKGAAR